MQVERPHENGRNEERDAKKLVDMELVISRLLQVGVTVSSVIILLGMLLLMTSHSTGYIQASYHLKGLLQYHHHNPGEFPVTVPEVFVGAIALKPFAVIMLGVLLLIATPVMRVAISLIAFAVEGDLNYVWITLYVLIVLVVSFALGRAVG